MKRKNIKLQMGITIILLGFLISLSLTSVTQVSASSNDASTSSECNLTALVSSPSLTILNNSAFDLYGLPGNGSDVDPYRIENLNITTADIEGIYISGVNVSFIIQNCYINAGLTGIQLYSMTVVYPIATIYNNYIEHNTIGGIALENALGINVTSNVCRGNEYGIYTNYADFSTFENNTCFNNTYGIYLFDTYDSFILENLCYENEYGIYGEYIYGNNYEGNVIKDGNYGFYAEEGEYIEIVNNKIENMTDFGMLILEIHFTEFTLNSVKDTGSIGMLVSTSNNLTVSNNSITYTTKGMVLNYVESSLFTFNRLQNNYDYGIYVDTVCNYNIFYYNSFINNVGGTSNPQAFDASLNSTWYDNSTQIGNYWDDYIGTGNYSIDGGLYFDLYPLGNSPVVPEFNPVMNSLYLLVLILFIPILVYNKKRQRK